MTAQRRRRRRLVGFYDEILGFPVYITGLTTPFMVAGAAALLLMILSAPHATAASFLIPSSLSSSNQPLSLFRRVAFVNRRQQHHPLRRPASLASTTLKGFDVENATEQRPRYNDEQQTIEIIRDNNGKKVVFLEAQATITSTTGNGVATAGLDPERAASCEENRAEEYQNIAEITCSKVDDDDDDEMSTYEELDDRHEEDVPALVQHFKHGGNRGNSGGGGESKANAVNAGNRGGRRAKAICPAGHGKTQISLQTLAILAKDGLISSAIFVAPRLKLVDQALDSLDRFGNLRDIPHRCKIVASSTNRTEGCTTNPKDIAEFLSSPSLSGSEHDESRPQELRLIVCTYQSLEKVGEAVSLLNRTIGMAIFDEAHNMAGAGNMFGYGLYDENLPVDYRLFLTATPDNYTATPKAVGVYASALGPDGSKKLMCKQHKDANGKIKRVKARSMNDESLFGELVVCKTHRESIEKNITVPKTLCLIEKGELSSVLGKDGTAARGCEEYWLPLVVQAAFVKLNVSKAISFHSRNARANNFVEAASGVLCNDIFVASVNGSQPCNKVERILAEANNALKYVVANCKLLIEGVDVPELDLVVLADPVRSPTAIKQIIGRVSRPAPNKQRGYVLVPLLYDSSGEGGDAAYGSNGLETAAQVFQAMVDDDPELERDVVFVMEKSKGLGWPLCRDEYPPRIREAFIFPNSWSLERRNEVMHHMITEVHDSTPWDDMFDLLRKYKDRKGDCNVPQNYTKGDKNLGYWVSYQRWSNDNGILSSDRKIQLDEIGFIWNVRDEKWEHKFSLLKKFKEEERHCNVPLWHVDLESGVKLGSWLDSQRMAKKKGNLDDSKQKLLEDLGVVWNVRDEKWEHKFSLLKQYKEQKGDCNVPRSHKEDGLGSWLNDQRMAKKKGNLDDSKQKLLEDLGVVWNVRDEKWEHKFSLLKQYKEQKGDCNVPRSHKEDGLGYWLHNQKAAKRNGKLKPHRQKRLEDLGVVFPN